MDDTMQKTLMLWVASFIIIAVIIYYAEPAMVMTTDATGQKVIQKNKVASYALLIASVIALLFFIVMQYMNKRKNGESSPKSASASPAPQAAPVFSMRSHKGQDVPPQAQAKALLRMLGRFPSCGC